jgi:hypothetical protein
MMRIIDSTANPMIGESPLPNFLIAPDDRSKFVRVRAFDQLNRTFDGHVVRRSQQEMNMLRHDHESMQGVAPFAAIPVNRLQEETHVSFDYEQFSAVERREGHEVSPGRGDEASRLQS